MEPQCHLNTEVSSTRDHSPMTESTQSQTGVPIDIQSDAQYTNLVLEGGGVLGVAYCGALEELESQGLLSNIINFAGASAGSIVAGALACGATSRTVTKIMRKLNFRNFLDYGNRVRAAYNVLRYMGACPGDYFSEWYGKIIFALTGNANINLEDIHKKYGGRLVISVVNVSKRRLEFWDYKLKPKMPLVLAVRASMSMEGIFMPVEIDGDLYVDGGTLCNYPIKAFHYNGPNGDVINPRTIGLMLMSDEEISAVYPPVNTLIEYALACIECVWSQPQKIHMDEQDWVRTVKIPTGAISSIDFNITEDEVRTLIASGRIAVAKHLNGMKTFTGDFHCTRAQHTADDEVVPTPRIYAASLPSSREHSPELRNRGRKSSQPTDEVFIATTPREHDKWETLLDGVISIDMENEFEHLTASSIDKTAQKVKKTVSSSPPIKIPVQFPME